MNPLITTDEVRHGELLAQTDDAEYRLISVVYKLNGTDKAAFYCSASDWPATEAGKAAALYAEIARLRAALADAQAKLGQLTVEIFACPICHKEFNRKNDCTNHIRIKHPKERAQ